MTVSNSSTYLPQCFETMNGRVCGYMVHLLNGKSCTTVIPRSSFQYEFSRYQLVLRAVVITISS